VSKSLKHILIPARELGWELWQLNKEKLERKVSVQNLNDSSIPKDTRIAFPASYVTTTPLTIPHADLTTQKGIARLQLEQSGLLKSGADSWDVYTVDKEVSLVAGVSLQNEFVEGDKLQLEQTFDLAARYYQVGYLDTIVCKKEQGNWLTICYKESNPFYIEPVDSLSSVLAQIKSLLIQFTVLKIPFSPEKISIEISSDEEPIEHELVKRLERELNTPIELVENIKPVLHNGGDLNLVPAQIFAGRKKKKRNEKLRMYLLICACLYIIGGMFLVKQHRQRENQIQQAQNQVTNLSPRWTEHQQDLTKLNELENLLTNQWPLATFEKVVSHLPSHQELRFQIVEIQASSILIKGVAPNINHINNLETALGEDPYFKNYNWRTIEKNEDKKTKLWSFSIDAIKKGAL